MKILLQAATLTALIMVATMSEAQTLRVKEKLFFSLDGSTFKPLPQVASGSFLFGAGSKSGDARANTLNMQLKAYMK